MLVDALKADISKLNAEAAAGEDYLSAVKWHTEVMDDLREVGYVKEPHPVPDEQIEQQKLGTVTAPGKVPGPWAVTNETAPPEAFPPGSLVSYDDNGERAYGVVAGAEWIPKGDWLPKEAVWAFWHGEKTAGWVSKRKVRLEVPHR